MCCVVRLQGASPFLRNACGCGEQLRGIAASLQNSREARWRWGINAGRGCALNVLVGDGRAWEVVSEVVLFWVTVLGEAVLGVIVLGVGVLEVASLLLVLLGVAVFGVVVLAQCGATRPFKDLRGQARSKIKW